MNITEFMIHFYYYIDQRKMLNQQMNPIKAQKLISFMKTAMLKLVLLFWDTKTTNQNLEAEKLTINEIIKTMITSCKSKFEIDQISENF